MATLTAGAGSTTWTSAAFSGGAASTAADEIVVPTGATLTISAANTVLCRSISVTGTGTLVFAATTSIVNLGDATAATGNSAFSIAGTATLTLTGIGTINFISTSTTLQTITTNGKTVPNLVFNGAGGKWQLADSCTSSGGVTVHQGTFDTNSQTHSWVSFTSGNNTTRVITLGSSAISLSSTGNAWGLTNAGTVTFSANTAVVTLTGAGATFSTANFSGYNGLSVVMAGSGTQFFGSGSVTLANLTRTGTASKTDLLSISSPTITVTGTFTVNSNSSVNRVMVASGTRGTAVTVNAASVVLGNVVDFMDITGAGAATWTAAATGATYIGDAGGNSSITTTTPATQTMASGGNWDTAANWTSRVPLPQDDVVLTGSSAATVNMTRLGKSIDLSGYTGTLTLTSSAATYDFFGSITLGSGMTWGAGPNTFNINASGRGTHTITSNGKALFPAGSNASFFINGPGSSYSLADAFDYKTPTIATFNVTTGSFDSNNQNMAIGRFVSTGTLTKSMTFGTTTVTTYATGGTALISIAATGATVSAANSTWVVGGIASASTRTIDTGGFRLGTFTYTLAGSTGQLSVIGNSTINTFNFSDASNARILQVNSGFRLTIGTAFNVFGSSGKLITIKSSVAASPGYISKPSGGILSTGSNDYLSIQDIRIVQPLSFWAGANSTNVSGNTNIYFSAIAGTYRHQQSIATTAASTAISATFPTATTAGNLLIAYTETAGTPGATVTPPSGWTQAVTASSSAVGYIYYKVSDGSETTVSYSQTTSRTLTMQLTEYSGFVGTPTLDVTDSNTSGTTTTSLSTTATTGPTNTDQPAIAVALWGSTSALAASVSLTNSFGEDYTQGLLTGSLTRAAVKELTTTAPVETTLTWTTSRANDVATLAVFKDVNSGLTITQTTVATIANNKTKTQTATARIATDKTKTQTVNARIIYPMDNLSDNFDDNSINTAIWAPLAGGNGTLTETNQQLEIGMPSSAVSGDFGRVVSQYAYSLTGSYAMMKIAQNFNTATAINSELHIYTQAGGYGVNAVRWVTEGTSLIAQKYESAIKTSIGSFTFNPVTHKWWRIRESGGTIYFDTSTDTSSWTNRFTYVPPFATDRMLARVGGGPYKPETNPGTFAVDNFNITPTFSSQSTAQTATARIAINPTSTQPIAANISVTVTKTQSLAARISTSDTKTQPSTARIATGLTKTQTVVADIVGAVSKTQPISARIAITTPPAQNKVTNGDFETGTGTTNANFSVTGWTMGTPAAATLITIDSDSYSGSQALKMAVDATNSLNGVRTSNAAIISVTPSTTYVFTALVKSDTPGQLQIQFRDGATNTSGNYVQTDGTTWSAAATYQNINTTTRYKVYTFTLTTGASQTNLYISDLKRSGNSTQANRNFWIDHITIWSGVRPEQFIDSRISITGTKTQPVGAVIKTTVDKIQPVAADIAVGITKTQTVNAHISNSYTKTQALTARISVGYTRVQALTARIATNLTKTQSVTAYVIRDIDIRTIPILRIKPVGGRGHAGKAQSIGIIRIKK